MRLSPTPSGVTARQVLAAQATTADWLDEQGMPTATDMGLEVGTSVARNTFAAMVDPNMDEEDSVERLLTLTAPEEIRHLVGMLSAYDWDFVAQAKNVRAFVVARLMKEATQAGRAGERIKALTALGKVTEVGLFTEKIEVKPVEASDEELDARIKERLAKLRGVMDALALPTPIQDAETKE